MSIRSQKIIFLRFAILVLLAGFSSILRAADYYWIAASNAGTASSTAAGACQKYYAIYGYVFSHVSILNQSSGSFNCHRVHPTNGTTPILSSASRMGTECPSGTFYNSGAGSCDVPPSCPAGKTNDPVSGECVWISSCPSGQSLLTTATTGGTVTSAQCVPNSANNFPCDTYARMQSSYCQSRASECKASGGSFGNIAGQNVCVPPGNGLPNCESGGTQFVTNPDGSKTPTCVGAPNINGNPSDIAGQGSPTKVDPATATAQDAANATANNTAKIANINNEGFQSVVNAINNMSGKTSGGGAGIGEGEGKGEGEGEGEGESGPCDPKKADYSACIKQTEEVGDGEAQSKIDSASNNVSTTFDDTQGEIIAMINGETVVDEPNGVVNAIDNLIPNSVSSCTNLGFNFRGHVFTIDCDKFQPLREMLAWVFALGTAIFCFQIAFAPRSI